MSERRDSRRDGKKAAAGAVKRNEAETNRKYEFTGETRTSIEEILRSTLEELAYVRSFLLRPTNPDGSIDRLGSTVAICNFASACSTLAYLMTHQKDMDEVMKEVA